MDGKGAWRDNVFVERLWRSVKYEEVYLRAYDSVSEARGSIGRYLNFYNGRRPHSSLDGATPIKPTSLRCPSAWQPNPGRPSTYRCGNCSNNRDHLRARMLIGGDRSMHSGIYLLRPDCQQ